MSEQKHGAKSNVKNKRHSKKHIRKKRRRILLALEVVLLLFLVVVLYAWNKVDKINWDTIDHIETNEFNEETVEILKGYTTVAIFGVDNRSMGNYDTGNSDSIMIAAINNETSDVKLMSVYRDSYLDIAEGNRQKCNAAYSRGGPEQALRMLNRNLDLDIQEYIAVDFKAVIDAVDAVGGIELEVTSAEAPVLNDYIPDIQQHTGQSASPVSAGYQTLNGVQALAYCRIRYTAGDDFRRAERQRTVLKLLVDKVKSANPKQLNDTINAIFPEISTSLSLTKCLAMAANVMDYEIADSKGWPIGQRTTNLGSKGSIAVPCTLSSNVTLAHEFLYNDIGYTPTSTVQEISDAIVNDTGFNESHAIDYITWHDDEE